MKGVLVFSFLMLLTSSTKSEDRTKPDDVVKLGETRERSNLLKKTLGGKVTASVSLCCGKGQLYNSTTMECYDSTTQPQPVFHHQGEEMKSLKFHAFEGYPNCSMYVLSPSTSGHRDKFNINLQGDLIVGYGNPENFSIPVEGYCIVFPEPNLMEAMVCFPEESQKEVPQSVKIQRNVYLIGLLISSFFLLLTLIVYIAVKELREDTLSKCFMCWIATLMAAQSLMASSSYLAQHLLQSFICYFIGAATLYFFLSAFLWLNVLSFLVCWSLRCTGSAPRSTCKVRPFTLFSVHCFGVPVIVALVALCRDMLPSMRDSILPAPHFAHASCWFTNRGALLVYLIGPITVLIVVNVLCFIYALYKMCAISRSAGGTTLHFRQYLKLFALTGVSWIFEVISFFANITYEQTPLHNVWIVFDVINMLQGVLVFCLFVCRGKVLRHLAGICCPSLVKSGEDKEKGEAPCNTVV